MRAFRNYKEPVIVGDPVQYDYVQGVDYKKDAIYTQEFHCGNVQYQDGAWKDIDPE